MVLTILYFLLMIPGSKGGSAGESTLLIRLLNSNSLKVLINVIAPYTMGLFCTPLMYSVG